MNVRHNSTNFQSPTELITDESFSAMIILSLILLTRSSFAEAKGMSPPITAPPDSEIPGKFARQDPEVVGYIFGPDEGSQTCTSS